MSPYVNVNVIITEGADMSNNRMERDLQAAEDIWGIRLNLQTVGQYDGFPEYRFVDREVPCGGSEYPKLENLINQDRNFDNDLFVYYIGGNTFSNGVSVGCSPAKYSFIDNTQRLVRAIILTNGAASSQYLFAHELGHALFARVENNRLINSDPTSGSSHSNLPNNLMRSTVPINPTLTSAQRNLALQSSLVREDSQGEAYTISNRTSKKEYTQKISMADGYYKRKSSNKRKA
ncbi:hypothetical protein H7S56_26050 [Priestia aryabhattai]|nr:hypothetical protein [Priestia aryabhattai]